MISRGYKPKSMGIFAQRFIWNRVTHPADNMIALVVASCIPTVSADQVRADSTPNSLMDD
jgi:hypothetical protein